MQQAGEWLRGSGPHSEVVISSRARLARNLAGFPFVGRASRRQRQEVVDRCREQVMSGRLPGNVLWVPLQDSSELDRQLLVERHLISRQHAQGGPDQPRAVGVGAEETFAIMVNEEDHLRIQVLFPAFQLGEAWSLANTVDDVLENKLDLAFDEQYGYLSCCPTNVGTGLRASVMMHLPALALTNQANGVFTALSKVGFVVRGLYGEGTEAKGSLFQISNQVTLGLSEVEILDKLVTVTRQVIEQEQMGRQSLMKERPLQIEDMVFRAYGVLTNARLLNSNETMFYLSCVRVGIDLGLLHGVSNRTMNELLVSTRAAFLQKENEGVMDAFNRSLKRAEVIRKALTSREPGVERVQTE
jgi:protein arginine kinase